MQDSTLAVGRFILTCKTVGKSATKRIVAECAFPQLNEILTMPRKAPNPDNRTVPMRKTNCSAPSDPTSDLAVLNSRLWNQWAQAKCLRSIGGTDGVYEFGNPLAHFLLMSHEQMPSTIENNKLRVFDI